jgi:hypothetical protein
MKAKTKTAPKAPAVTAPPADNAKLVEAVDQLEAAIGSSTVVNQRIAAAIAHLRALLPTGGR